MHCAASTTCSPPTVSAPTIVSRTPIRRVSSTERELASLNSTFCLLDSQFQEARRRCSAEPGSAAAARELAVARELRDRAFENSFLFAATNATGWDYQTIRMKALARLIAANREKVPHTTSMSFERVRYALGCATWKFVESEDGCVHVLAH